MTINVLLQDISNEKCTVGLKEYYKEALRRFNKLKEKHMWCKICKPKTLKCLTCHKNINPKEPFCFEKEACSIPYAMVRDGVIIGYESESETEIDETQKQREAPLDRVQEIYEAAKVLVDSVEKYVIQECSRSTLLSMKDKLKKLLEK